MSYNEQMRKIFAEYEAAGHSTPADLRDVAAWAIANKKWLPKPIDIHSVFAEQMGKALRDEYKTDSNGRRIRTKHSVRLNQTSFWADIDTAPFSHMKKAFGQRRKQIVGDCVQLSNDVDYYNSKNKDQPKIQLILDFTDDVLEANQLESLDEVAV